MTATAEASRVHIGHGDALTLLYAAVTGERGELGRLVRSLLLLHQVLPGTGQPWPDCAHCHGTGEVPATGDLAARHCHCRCDLCTCNDPLCAGPCDTLAVMLDALVLRGLPPAAADVPRTLDMLYAEGARRVVANTRQPATVVPVDDQPGTVKIAVGNQTAADEVERALSTEGYRCERKPTPGPVVGFRLTATYRH